MVPVARMRDRTGALDRLPAPCRGAERVVLFVVVVCAVRLSVVYVEAPIGEWFLFALVTGRVKSVT